MSEFTCRNNHLMKSSDKLCPQCGLPITYMDGMSARELRLQEEREDIQDQETPLGEQIDSGDMYEER
jgi:hypothetical protein